MAEKLFLFHCFLKKEHLSFFKPGHAGLWIVRKIMHEVGIAGWAFSATKDNNTL